MIEVNDAGMVICRKENNEPLFLLIRYPGRHWDFPKGRIEKGESPFEAAVRETKEETGITHMRVHSEELIKIRWHYKSNKQTIKKQVIFFLAETDEKEVKLSQEHDGYVWVNYKDAMEYISFENTRDTLQKAKETIELKR